MVTRVRKPTDTSARNSPVGEARSGAGLSPLQQAILATVTYRDLFDYPVTDAEIHRYLHGISCGLDEVRTALRDERFVRSRLASDGRYYALSGRTALFELRRARETASLALWDKAQRHAKRLAALPFVRMAAVTGSLAVNNPGDDADIDFMLVTDGGRLWSVRLMAKVMQLLDDRFSTGELCANHFVSMRALELGDRSLYAAQELAQMVPLFGIDTYDELRRRNPWVLEFLPNAAGAPPVRRTRVQRRGRTRLISEPILRSPLGELVETWERRRKLHKYNETAFLLGRSTPFGPEFTGHRRNVRESIENAFADRLEGSREQTGRLRILFGQAYHLNRDPKLYRAMQPFPPLGALYAAAVARSLGHIVRIHDSMLSMSIGEWAAAVQINDPDVVVLYEDNFNYLTKMCLSSMRDAGIAMIRIAKRRGASVLVCSSDSSDEPEPYLRAGADCVLTGEGEDTLADVLRLIGGSSDVDAVAIPGLAYLDDDDRLVRTGSRPVIRHVDDLPLPAWDLIDLGRYREIWTRRHGRFALNMVTTRGCPYHCNWCAKPIWGQRYNARSPEEVVRELAVLNQRTGVDYIWFMDDIFGLKPRWIRRFADALEQARLEIRFKCLSRPDLLLREGEIDALARAGCDVVWMGAESGSQDVLDAMEKGTTVDMIESACAQLRRHGIRVGMFIQFGYPGETRADIRATLQMLRRTMPDELGISVSYPLPGTRFYERVKAELGKTRHWRDSDDLAMLFEGPFPTGYYRALHRYVHSDIGARRAWRNGRPLIAAYSYLRKLVFAAGMSVTSRLPHDGLAGLPGAMGREEAAMPSEQDVD